MILHPFCNIYILIYPFLIQSIFDASSIPQQISKNLENLPTITMYKSKFTSRSLFFLLLVLSHFTSLSSQTVDLEDIEELIAIDDERENSTHNNELGKKSDVLSKAQRVVLELNSDNTKSVIEKNEYVLVLGYSPRCGRSAELMPRFAEAANILKGLESGVLFAKLDTERYPKPASSLGIKWFPTLLFFVNGTSQSYTGGFSLEEIVIWARKKTGATVMRVNSVAEANEFQKQHSMYAVGLFDKFEGADYGEFINAAAVDNETQFVEASSEEVAKVLYPVVEPTKPFFGLVKSEPEHYTSLDGEFTSDEILRFLENNNFPLVTIMTKLRSAKVFSIQVYVFAEADNLKMLLEPLREIAKKFKSQVMFVAADIQKDNLAKPFLALFGVEESEETVVIAFDYNSNTKYLLETDLTSRNIEDFCAGLVQGTLIPYYKSQPIPDNKNASILTVVGKTFDDLIISSPKSVVLEVHTAWCIMWCKTTSKQVEKLANHFKGLDTLVFARIDASTNEHPKLQMFCFRVEDYPTLLFYPASDKSNPIKLPTKSSFKELAALINKNLKTQDPSAKDEL